MKGWLFSDTCRKSEMGISTKLCPQCIVGDHPELHHRCNNFLWNRLRRLRAKSKAKENVKLQASEDMVQRAMHKQAVSKRDRGKTTTHDAHTQPKAYTANGKTRHVFCVHTRESPHLHVQPKRKNKKNPECKRTRLFRSMRSDHRRLW